jgi:hypothetical protein
MTRPRTPRTTERRSAPEPAPRPAGPARATPASDRLLAEALGDPAVAWALLVPPAGAERRRQTAARLQQVAGNQATRGLVEARLTMATPGGTLEQAADRAAERAMRVQAADMEPGGGETRARPPAPPGADRMAGAALGSPGGRLDPSIRGRMEALFDRDLSGVRIHADAQAAQMAEAVGARAFAVGNDLVFGRGQYAPRSPDGQRLLAHELAHVLQQPAGPAMLLQRQPVAVTASPVGPTQRVIVALSRPQETAGIGDFPAAFAILGQLSDTDLVVTLTDLDEQGYLDALIANASATPAAERRVLDLAVSIRATRQAASAPAQTVQTAAAPPPAELGGGQDQPRLAGPSAQVRPGPDAVAAAAPEADGPARADPGLRNVVLQLYAQLNSGTGASREDIFQTLLNYNGRQAELQRAYAERYQRSLEADLRRAFPDHQDAIRVKRYLHEGGLRLADRLYFAVQGLGTDVNTVNRLLQEASPSAVAERLERELAQGFADGDYDPEFKRTGRLPDGRESAVAGLLEAGGPLAPEMEGWVLAKAKALFTFHDLRPVDEVYIGLSRMDRTQFLEALRKADPATLEQELRASYKLDLAEVRRRTDVWLQNDDVARQWIKLALAGNLTLEKRFELAFTPLETYEAAIFEAIEQADFPARQRLRDLLTRREPSPVKELYESAFSGLNDNDKAQIMAMLGPEAEAGELADPAVHRLRALGGASGDDLVEKIKYATPGGAGDPDDFGLFLKSYTQGSVFHRYVDSNTSWMQRLRVDAVLVDDLDVRLRFARSMFGSDPGYLLHLLTYFAKDETVKARLRGAPWFTQLLGRLHADDRIRARALLAPPETNPVERATWTLEQARLETAEFVEPFNVAEARRDERRELRGALVRAEANRQVSDEERKEIRERLGRLERAMGTYRDVRDELEGLVSMAVQLAVGLVASAASAGGAFAFQLARAVLFNGLARLAAEKAVKGDRFEVFSIKDGLPVFLAGATEGLLKVTGPGLAQGLLRQVGLGAESAYPELSRTLARYVEEGLSGALPNAVETAASERTWTDVGSGIAKVLSSAGSGLSTAVATAGALDAARATISAPGVPTALLAGTGGGSGPSGGGSGPGRGSGGSGRGQPSAPTLLYDWAGVPYRTAGGRTITGSEPIPMHLNPTGGPQLVGPGGRINRPREQAIPIYLEKTGNPALVRDRQVVPGGPVPLYTSSSGPVSFAWSREHVSGGWVPSTVPDVPAAVPIWTSPTGPPVWLPRAGGAPLPPSTAPVPLWATPRESGLYSGGQRISGPYVPPQVPSGPSWRSAGQLTRRESWAQYAARRGLTPAAYAAAVDAKVAGLVAGADVRVRVAPSSIPAIVRTGGLRTQFDTGTTGGLLDLNARRATEHALWSTAPEVGGVGRPIYGYLGGSVEDTLEQYGSAVILLRPGVRARTTFAFGDTLDETRSGSRSSFVPQPLTSPSALTARSLPDYAPDLLDPSFQSLADVRTAAEHRLMSPSSTYVEAQIHGGVTVSDIDEIIFTNDYVPNATIRASLDAAKIKWRVVSGLTP